MKRRVISMLLSACMLATMFSSIPMTAFAETNVTRAEWIAKLVETFDMTVEDESTMPDNYFSDITSDMDCYEDILLATEFGVIDLDAGEAFEPNEAATREFAAQTLNYCLHFQLDENAKYTYSESANVSYPDDIQVAVNRGWFELSGNKFLPEQAITLSETEAMLADAENVLQAEYVDEAYESSYTLDDGIKEIPEYEDVTISSDYIVTVTDYDCDIAENDIFIAYSAGIPVALKALSVNIEDNVTTIEATTDGAENAITAVDSEGIAEFDLENFETNDVETYSVTDVETNETDEMEVKLRSISYDKKTKKLTATKDVKIGNSTGGSITVEVSNLKLYHKENTSTGDYMAYIEGNTSVTKSISFDLGNYVGIPSSITLGYINIGGVGSVSLDVGISIKGGMSSNETGVITAGWSHTRNDGFRIIKGYKKTAYSFTAEAEVKVGLTLSAQIDLVVVNGSIWATVGVKGYYKFKDYTYVDGERPLQCKTIGGYLYANVGARVSINYFVDKKSWSKTVDIYTESNSPIRVYYHYEDNQLVDSCTRGKTNNDTYVKYTTHTNSIHFNPSPSYGQSSYTGSDGSTTTLWTYTTDNDGNATITGYKGSATSIAIPSKVDGYTVTKIGNSAFKNNTKLRSVTITDSVTEIGNYAFDGCTLLTNVSLSNKVESVGYYAFRNCKALKKVKIPKTLTKVSSDAIFSGSGLESAEFDEGITKIPAYIFKNAQKLKSVIIPDSVIEIDNGAFYACTLLTSITIPDTVTKIGNGAFSNCTKLSSVKLSKNLETLDSWAFTDCTALKHIKIPKTLTEVSSDGIFDGSGLESVEFEDGMTQLPSNIFRGAQNLKTVPLLDTMTEIGSDAFNGCTSLESITIPDSVAEIGSSAFRGCTSLAEINLPDSITSMGDSTFYGCTSLEKVKLPNTRQNIMASMFYNCKNLKEITLPDTVTAIRSSAFYGCASLPSINLPEGLQTIENNAFYECKALTEITIPQNVTSIGSSAFDNCDALTSAVINGSGSIGSFAFYDCDALTIITIGDKVTSIGSQMCYGCDKLTDVKLGKGITEIPDSAFRLCASLETVTIPRFCKKIAANAFAENTKLTTVYVPTVVSSIQTNSLSYPKKTTMYGKSGSYAEEYANSRSMAFVAVDTPITTLAYPESNIKIAIYTTVTPNMQIVPEFDTDTITFTSSDTSIATVSESGAVYGRSYGTTTITMTTESGLSDSIEITVVRPATSVNINKEGLEIAVGNSETLVATINPTNSTDVIKWSSDNTDVAAVDDSGKITAVSKGTANITATAVYGNKSATCLVTVVESNVPIVNVTGITLNSNEQEITIGNTYTLRASVLPDNATNKLVEWTSSNSSVADVINGVVTAKSLGESIITVKTVSGSFTATCKITVVPKVEITAFTAANYGANAFISLSTVNAPSDAVVYVASYDDLGKLLELQTLTLNNGSANAIFSTSSVYKYKAFVWKGNTLKPHSASKEYIFK